MKLTLLGTGEFRPDVAVGSAGYVVQTDSTTLKLDFGRGNLVNMAATEVDWKQIDAIVFSHTHPDHIGDLLQYLQAYTLLHKDGTISKDVQLYGPNGFAAFFDHLRRVVITTWDHIPVARDLIDEKIEIGDLAVQVAETDHTVSSIGMRVESQGKALCYTGDAALSDNLKELARDVDVLLTECAGPSQGHMSPQEVAQLANEARAQKVVLTHYPAEPTRRAEIQQEVAALTGAEVIAGQDQMVIEI